MGRIGLFRFVAVLGFIAIAGSLIMSIVNLVDLVKAHADGSTITKEIFLIAFFTVLSIAGPLLFWTVADLLEDKIDKETNSLGGNLYGIHTNYGIVSNEKPKEILADEKNIEWMYKHGIIDEDQKNKKLKELHEQQKQSEEPKPEAKAKK